MKDVVKKLINKTRDDAVYRHAQEETLDHNYQKISSLAMQEWVPTDEIEGIPVRRGLHTMNGATVLPGCINFTLYSLNATSCELLLFRRMSEVPFATIPIPDHFRVGGVWSIMLFGLNIEEFEYCYRLDGPNDPDKGIIFDRNKLVLDPYAMAVVGQRNWGESIKPANAYHARVVRRNFQWDAVKWEPIPMEDSVIYELHVRSFTMDKSSGVQYPGTFAGIMEKIPYLKELGITAVELMPVFQFDEMTNSRTVDGKLLYESWGYNTVAFFAPESSYAASAEYNREGKELKQLIQMLHNNGIEVILDVVFNHTAEGNEDGPFISFKGIDNNIYYMLDPEGNYYNFSGCGNTFNCNHPIVQKYIVDCLRYWTSEYHVDGFRFDLASILGRAKDGSPMEDPPLLERIALDPMLSDVKLIAEAWDAGGVYQVGSFPAYNRWAEWNGKYRDCLRDYLKGGIWHAPEAAMRITGSEDLYHDQYQGYESSVNFITCHDGFTLYDLYSYGQKHNDANGWNNEDGSNDNRSWNCGIEGPTDDPKILALRFQMMRNAVTMLMCSRGTPMILSGDEFGNTQYGNNNSYCQDNEISWLDWKLLKTNRDYFEFYKNVIHYRKMHPVIRKNLLPASCGLPQIMTSGADPDDHRISTNTQVLGVLFSGREEGGKDDAVYMASNVFWEYQIIRLPSLPAGYAWGLSIDTAEEHGHFYYEEPEYLHAAYYTLKPRSAAVFTLIRK